MFELNEQNLQSVIYQNHNYYLKYKLNYYDNRPVGYMYSCGGYEYYLDDIELEVHYINQGIDLIIQTFSVSENNLYIELIKRDLVLEDYNYKDTRDKKLYCKFHILNDTFVPIAKKYIDMKVESDLKIRFTIAKDLGIDVGDILKNG